MTATLQDFDHRCTEKICSSFGQRTDRRSCLCHVSREDMMLAELNRQRETIASLVSERDALKAQISEAVAKDGARNRSYAEAQFEAGRLPG